MAKNTGSFETRLLCLVLLLLASAIGGLASVGATPTAATPADVQFASSTRIVAFQPGVGQWSVLRFDRAKPGTEFYSNRQLFRVTGPGTARVVIGCDTTKLFEADRPADNTSRAPQALDIVQVLNTDTLPAGHTVFGTVQAGTSIRFQGKAYSVTSKGLATVPSRAISTIQHIEVTQSAWQHITDRHTIGGSKNAGASIFYPNVDIKALIRDAEIITPVLESNGYVSREMDAGRIIGYQGNRQTSTYRVIATQSGKLVTAYPIVQQGQD